MIPNVLIIMGILAAVVGVAGLLSLSVQPFIKRLQIVYGRKEDYLAYESEEGKELVSRNVTALARDFIVLAAIGTLSAFLGFYLGYAARGENFWLYKKVAGEKARQQEPQWDKLNEKGNYVAQDGTEYFYYILVEGEKISLNTQVCESVDDLRDKLKMIDQKNTLVLIDNFAASRTYREIETLLKELGIKYEKGEE